MDDIEARWVWAKLPEYRWLFGSLARMTAWLDQPGTVYEGRCVRRRPSGEWIISGCFSGRTSRREAILKEGLLIIERDLWALERSLIDSRNQRPGEFAGFGQSGKTHPGGKYGK